MLYCIGETWPLTLREEHIEGAGEWGSERDELTGESPLHLLSAVP